MSSVQYLIGKTLGKYTILDHIGHGGMSEVYKGQQAQLNRMVAIKVLHPFLADEEGFVVRFQREARIVANLRHRHIVQVFDFDKYNFVTPIIKPDAMERTELLDRVMNNYRRFYLRKTLFKYPWIRDKVKRRYMLGCLKAFAKSGFQRTFYDLGRVGYWGPQSKKGVDFAFDTKRERPMVSKIEWKGKHQQKVKGEKQVAVMACGGGDEQLEDYGTPPAAAPAPAATTGAGAAGARRTPTPGSRRRRDG